MSTTRDKLPADMAAKKAQPKSRSGAKWTDADYAAAGWERPTIRIPTADLRKLDTMADEIGESRSGMISKLVAEAWATRKK